MVNFITHIVEEGDKIGINEGQLTVVLPDLLNESGTDKYHIAANK